ncbi:MAG: hypothetical protein HY471_01685 [Candidatus Sungbacteria bacterium]|nr:hypothetical protein [Candidatus Sungbacteria bacterium]
MRQSNLFGRTLHEAPRDETAVNAVLLARAGYVHKLMAGVYQYLPLGVRVLRKIEDIIREEMNVIGAEEVLMPALHPKENWERTGRFHGFDALYKVVSHFEQEFALAPTHEESVVPLAGRTSLSYRDLPFGLYQIQTKFRDEARAKSGLLRGREFRMKDLYSFHASQASLDEYYEMVAEAYEKIFRRCGIPASRVKASGGTFSQYSDEFQVFTEAGEDLIFISDAGEMLNRELMPEELQSAEPGSTIQHERKEWRVLRAAEVGNIFKLGTTYSKPFGLSYKTEDGAEDDVLMGCYGIGSSRIMGTIVEVSHDKNGIIWPEAVAPYRWHIIPLSSKDENINREIMRRAEELYASIAEDALLDDRDGVSPGEKFADSDLIGMPHRVVISEKTIEKGGVEVKVRKTGETKIQSALDS